MGLDNGISLEKRYGVYKYGELSKTFSWLDKADDVCYWRKFWSFRDAALAYLNEKYNEDFDGKETELDIDDLYWFLGALEAINNKKGYEAACDNYWDWDETGKYQIPAQIASLKALIELIKEDDKKIMPDYRVLFYDSY